MFIYWLVVFHVSCNKSGNMLACPAVFHLSSCVPDRDEINGHRVGRFFLFLLRCFPLKSQNSETEKIVEKEKKRDHKFRVCFLPPDSLLCRAAHHNDSQMASMISVPYQLPGTNYQIQHRHTIPTKGESGADTPLSTMTDPHKHKQ